MRQYPGRVAIQQSAPSPGGGPARLEYRELDARVARLAGALAALGVTRGDRVALLSEIVPNTSMCCWPRPVWARASPEEFPRSASGKVQRHELEKRLVVPAMR